MATPTKRAKYSTTEVSIDGYIHNVSPIKTSRNGAQFFNATLQSQTGYEQMVSWKSDAHRAFKDMEKASTAVHLDRLETIPSYTKPGSFDFKFGMASQILKPRDKLTFGPKAPESSQKLRTLQDIITKSSTFEKVDIIAKCIQISSPVPLSEKLTKLSLRIADSTGTIQMVVWNNHIDEIAIARSYLMKNITVREFNNEKTLSSNPESSFEVCDDLNDVVIDDTDLEKTMPIDSVQITSGKVCNVCNTRIATNEQLPTVRCSSCNRKFKTTSLTEKLAATITCDGIDYIISKHLLSKCIPNLDTLTNDEIEDQLLLQMLAVISDRSVVKLVLK